MKYVDSDGLRVLVKELARAYDVYAPVRQGDSLTLRRIVGDASSPPIAWNDRRLAESYKPFFFPAGRVVSSWVGERPQAARPPRPRALFGLKACDLVALGVVDRVFRDHEMPEEGWCAAREAHLVIAGDCSAHGPSCFCTMLGHGPWPEAEYDLALAPHEGGWIVEVGSAKGQALVRAHPGIFLEPPPGAEAAREKRREELAAALQELNRPFATRDPFAVSVEKNTRTRIWGRLAATCVECNACNHVCPTCHCFLLSDVPTDTGAARLSLWDSCFHAGYARMAGGGTPRLQLTERFRNHYFHKFVAFPRTWGVTACSGCGRCIDACMGHIDKRDCLHRLETEWLPSEVLEEIR